MNDKSIKDIIDSRLGSICVDTELKEKISRGNLVPKKKPMWMPSMVAACLCIILVAAVLVRNNTLFSRLGSMFQKQINSTNTTNNTTDGNSTKELKLITIAGQVYSIDQTSLDLSSKGLTDIDIKPLKYMTNLVELNLSGNKISDLTPLESLTDLSDLVLYSNEITDLTPLKSLTNLKTLSLSDNKLNDITAIEYLANLMELYLSNNQIKDITPLESLNKLIYLDLTSNEITDLTPLKSLTNLRHLNLNDNQLNDITVMGYLTNLKELYLSNNQIKDITSLKSLNDLSYLDISRNDITDITPLKLLINLISLAIYQNQFNELSPLKLLTDLNSLDVSYVQISDLMVLKSLTNLQMLNVRGYLTSAQKQKLADVLPNCEISIVNSTEDTPNTTSVPNTTSAPNTTNVPNTTSIQIIKPPKTGIYTPVTIDAFNGHTYSIFNDSISWYEARSYCESLGGHLVTITSAQEQGFLESLIYSTLYKDQVHVGKGQFYIGATDEAEEGIWRWITGEAFDYTNWYIPEVPYSYPENNYAVISSSYGWDTTQNKYIRGDGYTGYDYTNTGFICEWEY